MNGAEGLATQKSCSAFIHTATAKAGLQGGAMAFNKLKVGEVYFKRPVKPGLPGVAV